MSKILYCNNCGKQGHISNDCKIPITSVGIILIRYENNIPYYLFVRRKETFGYSDLVRGKYPIYNNTFIQNLVNEMSTDEKREIKNVLNEIENNGKDPARSAEPVGRTRRRARGKVGNMPLRRRRDDAGL